MRNQTLTAVITTCLILAALTFGPSVNAATYKVHLNAIFNPDTEGARVVLRVEQKQGSLRRLNFSAPADFFDQFKATSGAVKRTGERVLWEVPKKGGELSWQATLSIPKGDGYDAFIQSDWALLRLEDLFPPVRSTARKGTTSNFTLQLEGPKGWSFETPYGRQSEKPLEIESDRYNFDRPAGWLIGGDLGVRREPIAGRAVTVAAPTGSRFPRIPMLAFLRWTLPEFVAVFPTLPDRLLVVSGGSEMWRGALSGPASLFVHADRPLISENGTSTLLHELVHVATRLSAAPGDDWIVEGLAEYYSLEILRRSDGLSPKRFSTALDSLNDWATREHAQLQDPSKGANTAFAALLFHDIATELRERPEYDPKAQDPLDAAIAHMMDGRIGTTKVSRTELRASIKAATGRSSKVLAKAIKKAAE